MTDAEVRATFNALAARRAAPHRKSETRPHMLRELLAFIEENGEQLIESDGTAVLKRRQLDEEGLRALFHNKACALHVPQFVSRATCSKLSRWMLATSKITKWKTTDMYFGLGLPVQSMYGPRVENCLDYFRKAVPNMRNLREAIDGTVPLDKLRLELDEVWPTGANVSADNPYHRKMFVGLGRVMRPEGAIGKATRTEGLIHVDASVKLDPNDGAFSANVYMQVPTQGGELAVWAVNERPTSTVGKILATLLRNAFYPDFRERIQRGLRTILPPPIEIKVKPGDLVIINTGRPHAVRGFSKGTRLTMQTFVIQQAGRPLQLYS